MKGLILAGGKSSRMGVDKALLKFQSLYAWQILLGKLRHFCDEVYISCRKDQTAIFPSGTSLLYDREEECGPISGILSAIDFYPDDNWLVIAVDMPFIDLHYFEQLTSIKGSAFFRSGTFIEPLFGIYSPAIFPAIKTAYENGNTSLQKILHSSSEIHLISIPQGALQSINTPEDYKLSMENE